MQYRIVRLTELYYESRTFSLLKSIPHYESLSYSKKLNYYFNNTAHMGSFHSHSLSNSMRIIGHEVLDIIYDFELLQKTWALENGIIYNDDEWPFDILMAQIKHYKPDVVFVQSHSLTSPGKICRSRRDVNIMEVLKDHFPFIRLCALFSGFPAHYKRIQHADLLFAGTPSICRYYSDFGAMPILLYHGFDGNLLERGDFRRDGYNSNQEFNFTFVGSSRAPESRYWALLELLKQTDIELWVVESENVHRPEIQPMKLPVEAKLSIAQKTKLILKTMLKQQLYKLNQENLIFLSKSTFLPNKLSQVVLDCLDEKSQKNINEEKSENFFIEMKRKNKSNQSKLPKKLLHEMYPHRCHEQVMGLDMYRILNKSKLTFNKHTDYAQGDVGNMRLFEATGVGTCLLTDAGNNMSDLFEEDKEVVTYHTIDEAIEKAKYLIDHKDVRRKIARAGQERTLKDHTVFSRCELVDEAIQKML